MIKAIHNRPHSSWRDGRAKLSALEELSNIKKNSKLTKSGQTLSLTSCPFPEAITEDSSEFPNLPATKRKKVKKGKLFVTKEQLSSIIDRVNKIEEENINKKRTKQEQYLAKELQRQSNRLQKKVKKEETIKKGKELLKQSKKEPFISRSSKKEPFSRRIKPAVGQKSPSRNKRP